VVDPGKVSAGTIVKLANQSYSDVRGGDPRGKHKKPSLVATIRPLVRGRKLTGAIRGEDTRSEQYRQRLIQETERNQRLAQELKDIKLSDSNDRVRRERRKLILENEQPKTILARYGISGGRQRRMSSVSEDPNLNYLLSLFISKAQASTEVDTDLGILILNMGSNSALSSALERLIA